MWCLQEKFRLYSSPIHGQEFHWSRYFRLLWKRDGRILKHLRHVASSSKSLSYTETQHLNVGRELIGVVFGIEHFKHFTFGKKTHIITDHKPLLTLFQKSLTNTTPHLSRLLFHVSEYDIQLHYQPWSSMKLSDALSRQSNHSTDAGNKTEIKGLNVSIHEVNTNISERKLNNIHEETLKEGTMQNLIRHILEGWSRSQEMWPDSIKDFYSFIMNCLWLTDWF